MPALAQGMLSGKDLNGIPSDSRAAQGKSLSPEWLTEQSLAALRGLNAIAEARGQSLAQMAIAWVLRGGRVTSALIGASRPEQVVECAGAVANTAFTPDELARIDALSDQVGDINLWASSSEEG